MGQHRPVGYEFRVLLASVLLMLVAYPTLSGPAGSPLLAQFLLTAVFLAGGWVVFVGSRLRLPALLLGGVAVLGAWTGYSLPDQFGRPATVGFHTAAGAFQAFVVAVLLRRVYRERTVSVDAVAAALCGYLLLGVAFGHAYCLIEAALPGSLRGFEPAAGGQDIHIQLNYFSFVTLTTAGYGDIVPVGDAARSLAVVEAVTGQFYLAVLVADLVGKRIAFALSPAEPGGGAGAEPRG